MHKVDQPADEANVSESMIARNEMVDNVLGIDVSKGKFDGALRRALYWPAIVAMRHNPILRPSAQRLRAAGKPKLVVIAAVMRKLLHLAFGVLKHGRPFDRNYHALTA